MALRFRDRFFTPRVARAVTSPLGILLAGAGAAVGIVTGLGPVGAVAIGAVAWAGRVLAAVPRPEEGERIDPFSLQDPWRQAVADALKAQARFRVAVKEVHAGPLRDRMQEIEARVAAGVEEAWRIGRQGQKLVTARRHIDVTEAQRELNQLQGRSSAEWQEGGAVAKTAQSLQAELATAARLDQSIVNARDTLGLTNARLDEAVARAVELSVKADDVADLAGLGNEVDALVTDLEALRQGMEAVDQPMPGTA
jgi:hypothetical protein